MAKFNAGDIVAVNGTIAKGYGTVAVGGDTTAKVLVGTKLINYNAADIANGVIKPKFAKPPVTVTVA